MTTNYRPPATPLSAAIQYPLDANWQGRVINAYMKMERERQKGHSHD